MTGGKEKCLSLKRNILFISHKLTRIYLIISRHLIIRPELIILKKLNYTYCNMIMCLQLIDICCLRGDLLGDKILPADYTLIKVKSSYNPLRLGTVIVLVSSGIDFVNTPPLYSD